MVIVFIAEAINKIVDQNPKVLGIDAIFKEKKEPFVDSILNVALHKSDKIVTAFFHLSILLLYFPFAGAKINSPNSKRKNRFTTVGLYQTR